MVEDMELHQITLQAAAVEVVEEVLKPDLLAQELLDKEIMVEDALLLVKLEEEEAVVRVQPVHQEPIRPAALAVLELLGQMELHILAAEEEELQIPVVLVGQEEVEEEELVDLIVMVLLEQQTRAEAAAQAAVILP